MGNDPSMTVDNVNLLALLQLERGNEVPDFFKSHFGSQNPEQGVVTRVEKGNPHCHVWFAGGLGKENGAKIRFFAGRRRQKDFTVSMICQ